MKIFFKEREDDEKYQFSLARDIAVDDNQNIFIIDGKECFINKYNKNGLFVTTFGRKGNGPGEINNAYGMTFSAGKVYIPEYLRLNIFSEEGIFERSMQYPLNIQVLKLRIINNKYAVVYGFSNNRLQLINYNILSSESNIKRITSIDISEDISRRFLGGIHILFDITKNLDIIYSYNNEIEIKKYSLTDNTNKVIISAKYHQENISESTLIKLKENRKKYPTLNQIPIPEYYELLRQLIVDDKDNIWLYIKSKEKTGFFKYSKEGKYQDEYNLLLPDSKFDGYGLIIIKKNQIYLFQRSPEEGAIIYHSNIE